MPKEQYMCQLCANHGVFNQPKKGHKQKCPYKECPCPLCALNTKRRALDQIERQLKSTDQQPVSPTSIKCPSPSSSTPVVTVEAPRVPQTSSKATKKPAPIPEPAFPTALRISPSAVCMRKSPIITKSGAYMVALPPTITKKEMRRSLQLREQQAAKRARSIDEAIENLHSRQQTKSIFTSAELLAG
ncbi:unnamed protein product, partial [Mesorhabditis spiculigera]